MSFVDQGLNLHGITFACLQLIKVTKGNVLKTMNFTNGPEDVIFIFSHSLDFEILGVVSINWLSFCESVKHLGFGERTRGVDVEVLFDFTLGISVSHTILKNSELGDEIVVVQISIGVDSISFMVRVPLL